MSATSKDFVTPNGEDFGTERRAGSMGKPQLCHMVNSPKDQRERPAERTHLRESQMDWWMGSTFWRCRRREDGDLVLSRFGLFPQLSC
jgi:hypothetical protein